MSYNSLFDLNPDGIVGLDFNGRLFCMNAAFKRITGYTHEELIGKNVLELFFGPNFGEALTALDGAIRGEIKEVEIKIQHRNGHWIDISVTNVPIVVNHEPTGLYAVVKDITARKKMELALSRSQDHLAQAQRLAHLGSWDLDIETDKLFWSDEMYHMLGLEPRASEDFEDFFNLYVHPDDRVKVKTAIVRALEGQPYNIEYRNLRSDGSVRFFHSIGDVLFNAAGQPERMIGSTQDITDWKTTELLLQESEAKYRLIAENMTDFVIVVDKDGLITYASPSCFPMLAYPADQFVQRSMFEKVHPDDLQFVRQSFADAVKAQVFPDIELRLRHQNGSYVTIEGRGKAVVGIKGEVDNFVVSARDITDRKRMEEALRRKEESLAFAQQIAHLGNWDQDLIANESFSSNELFRIMGLQPDEIKITFDSYLSFVHPDDRERLSTAFENYYSGEPMNIEYRIVRPEGSIRTILSHWQTIYDKSGQAIRSAGTIQDISERKKTDELLRKSDKLSVTGQLAAGVAHEIRNPLSAVKGFIELMQGGTSKPLYFEIMLSEIQRIEAIIDEFLMLAKPQSVQFKPANLGNLLKNMITLVNTQAILRKIQILLKQKTDIPLVYCDENQMRQVFINLLKNAIEAMPAGGEILVEYERHGEDVMIRVSDAGCGIPADRLQKLAEPFYSTKEKGTGLGLMVCYKIVQQHQGSIHYLSEVNKGTTVVVTLPVRLQEEALIKQQSW